MGTQVNQSKTLLEYDDMTDILEVPKFGRISVLWFFNNLYFDQNDRLLERTFTHYDREEDEALDSLGGQLNEEEGIV